MRPNCRQSHPSVRPTLVSSRAWNPVHSPGLPWDDRALKPKHGTCVTSLITMMATGLGIRVTEDTA